MPNVRNDVLMISSREREEKELFKLVAKKCKFAREVLLFLSHIAQLGLFKVIHEVFSNHSREIV